MHIDLDIKQGFTNIAPNNFSFCNAQQTADLFARGLVNSDPESTPTNRLWQK